MEKDGLGTLTDSLVTNRTTRDNADEGGIISPSGRDLANSLVELK